MHTHDRPLSRISELKASYQSTFQKGFMVALLFHLVAGVGYMAYAEYAKFSQPVIYNPITFEYIPPPLPLDNKLEQPNVEVIEAMRPMLGLPEPVDESLVSPEVTIATQTEMSQQVAPILPEDVAEEKIILEIPEEVKITIEEEKLPPFSDWTTPYEEMPVLISQPKPVYPEMAIKTETEGIVILGVLIDTEGKVRDIRVIKSVGAGLDEAAVEAVRQSTWTPALQNHRPVTVWVSYPIRFTLR